jgi:uncharacterized protein
MSVRRLLRRGAVRRLLVLLQALVLGCAAAPAGAAETPGHPNHLLGQSSPYLQQHLYNPVDWYPWGEQALARARQEQKPIFLSIGYSACHWCHVMEREAFSDPQVAALLNARFVPIKVDREERPDLDDIYMTAVVAMTGSGGWPLSAFLTPDLQPFYGATYLPTARLLELLKTIGDAWNHRRGDILASARRIAGLIEADQRRGAGQAVTVDADALLQEAVRRLRAAYDRDQGGFGGAPKFPPHGALWLLLRAGRDHGDAGALDMAVRTLDAMARGGIYDQLGGGFHRYATDARWRVPHFEKMLYDNALLVPVYLAAWKASGREEFRRVGVETLAWVAREMTGPEGGFDATLDADSEGEEGRFYVWTEEEFRRAVGPRDADLAADWFGVTAKGDVAGGGNVLHIPQPLPAFAARHGLQASVVRERIDAARRALLQARARRPRPHRDDKVLTSWNGLMISALACAYREIGDARYREAAEQAARFLLRDLRRPDGTLYAVWREGRARLPGYLDDYAFLARGLLDLHDATGEPQWLQAAAALVRAAEPLRDAAAGGYFFTAAGQRDLIVRTKSLDDGALPSGNAVMADCLARLARERGDAALLAPAARIVALASPALRAAPLRSPYMVLAALRTTETSPNPAPVDAAVRHPGRAAPAVALAGAPVAAPETPSTASAPPVEPYQGTIVGRANRESVVRGSATAPAETLRPGQALTLSIHLVIKDGWHVNSSRPTLPYLIPTRVELPAPQGGTTPFETVDVAYPPGDMVSLQFAKERLSVYEGKVVIRATVRPPPDAAPGDRVIRPRVTYQACSNLACLAPETQEFAIPVRVQGEPVAVAPAPSPAPPAQTAGAAPRGGLLDALSGGEGGVAGLLQERGMLALLGVIFLAGLALNLTPCVYPMLPVTIGFFASQASERWGRRIALPALYVLGMALTYSALGLAAALTGSLFGATLQSPWVVGGLIMLFVIMALSMFGLFEIRLPGWVTRLGAGRRGGVGALLMGLTVGLVAAPCIGPFVVPLLVFVGASGRALLGFVLFFVLAIGLGLPSLVLGIFSGTLASLPRSGVWLIYAKKVMGVALLAVALYFTQPFLSDRVFGLLVIGFSIAAAAYLGFLERSRLRARWFPALKAGIGALVLALGLWFAVPLVAARTGAAWRPYAPEAIEQARAAGRPVVIDFFADWCLPCKELDRYAFSDARVLEELRRFTLLKADLTSFESEPVRALRDRFDVIGVPTIVFIDGQGREHRELRLYGFEDAAALLARLRRVPE